MCVCACVCARARTHTHTHICVCMYVCVYILKINICKQTHHMYKYICIYLFAHIFRPYFNLLIYLCM